MVDKNQIVGKYSNFISKSIGEQGNSLEIVKFRAVSWGGLAY